jgi:type 1 glutamine amidotransferase
MFEDCTILCTAWCDPAKPKGTGKHEPVVWVSTYGQGRVCTNVLGHDTAAIANEHLRELLRRGVEWAATGKVKQTR